MSKSGRSAIYTLSTALYFNILTNAPLPSTDIAKYPTTMCVLKKLYYYVCYHTAKLGINNTMVSFVPALSSA